MGGGEKRRDTSQIRLVMNRLFRVLVPLYFKSGMSLDAPALLNNEGPGPRVPQALVSAGLRAGSEGAAARC